MPWTNQDLVLYHGTLNIHLPSIQGGVNPALGRQRADFGRGFYTTTVEGQARHWARLLVLRSRIVPRPRPAVVSFALSRDDLAKLEALWFVRGTTTARD